MDDIEDLNNQGNTKGIHQTLEILEKMGVIVSVVIVDPKTHKPLPTNFYRRVRACDQWQWDE